MINKRIHGIHLESTKPWIYDLPELVTQFP